MVTLCGVNRAQVDKTAVDRVIRKIFALIVVRLLTDAAAISISMEQGDAVRWLRLAQFPAAQQALLPVAGAAQAKAFSS